MNSEQSARDGMELAQVDKQSLRIGAGKPGPGRGKGTLNRTTALLKDAILLAAKRAGGDGDNGLVDYLTTQAVANPGPFMSLLGKVLPMTVAGDTDNPLRTITTIRLVAAEAPKPE